MPCILKTLRNRRSIRKFFNSFLKLWNTECKHNRVLLKCVQMTVKNGPVLEPPASIVYSRDEPTLNNIYAHYNQRSSLIMIISKALYLELYGVVVLGPAINRKMEIWKEHWNMSQNSMYSTGCNGFCD